MVDKPKAEVHQHFSEVASPLEIYTNINHVTPKNMILYKLESATYPIWVYNR